MRNILIYVTQFLFACFLGSIALIIFAANENDDVVLKYAAWFGVNLPWFILAVLGVVQVNDLIGLYKQQRREKQKANATENHNRR